MCYGADVASKPYDHPEPVKEGFSAGLTSAEAIGERGTQLAMKRFHDVSSSSSSVRKILAGNKAASLSEVISEILTLKDKEKKYSANKELPQSLIHFEAAAAYSPVIEGGYISDIAGEKVSRLLVKKPDEDFHFSDALRTTKSHLIWEGGKNHHGIAPDE